MFDHQLFENYGHAMEIYASWLVNNLEEAVDLMRQVQARIDKEVQFSQRERFWSAVVACNIAGALMAKDIGVIPLGTCSQPATTPFLRAGTCMNMARRVNNSA